MEKQIKNPRVDTKKMSQAAQRLIRENKKWLKEMAKK